MLYFFLQLNYFYLALVFEFVSGFDIRISYLPGSLIFNRLPGPELTSRTNHCIYQRKSEGP